LVFFQKWQFSGCQNKSSRKDKLEGKIWDVLNANGQKDCRSKHAKRLYFGFAVNIVIVIVVIEDDSDEDAGDDDK
jgi:hypothetical protein